MDTSLPFGNIVFKALLLEAATSGWNIRTVRTTASSCTFWSFSLSACQPVSLSKSSWGLENAPQRSTKSQSYAHQMHGGNHFDGLNIQNPERTLHVRRLQRQVTSHYPWLQKCKITKLGIEAWNCLEQKVPLCCTETTETLSARNGQ